MARKIDLVGIAWGFILLIGLFCRYTEHFRIWKICTLALFIVLLSKKMFNWNFCKSLNILHSIVLVVVVVAGIFFDNTTYLFGNFMLIVWPILFATIICSLVNLYGFKTEIIFFKLIIPLNIMFVFNIILALLQSQGTPVLIKNAWLEYNSFYPDLCCGLFGLNGTHEFSTFTIFMNIYLLCYARTYKKRNRGFIYIYLVVVDSLLLYLSTKNDNVAMFVILPAFIIIFLFVSEYLTIGKICSVAKKSLKYVVPLLIIGLVVVNIPTIKSYIDEYVIIRIKMVIGINKSYYHIAGSNERFAIVRTALSQPSGWLFGKGFGSADLGGGNFFEFPSFGLSSIGSFIMCGGIWFYFAYTLLLTNILSSVFSTVKDKRPLNVVIFLVTVFYTAYTILYTSFVTNIWYSLIFAMLGLLRNNISNKSKWSVI